MFLLCPFWMALTGNKGNPPLVKGLFSRPQRFPRFRATSKKSKSTGLLSRARQGRTVVCKSQRLSAAFGVYPARSTEHPSLGFSWANSGPWLHGQNRNFRPPVGELSPRSLDFLVLHGPTGHMLGMSLYKRVYASGHITRANSMNPSVTPLFDGSIELMA